MSSAQNNWPCGRETGVQEMVDGWADKQQQFSQGERGHPGLPAEPHEIGKFELAHYLDRDILAKKLNVPKRERRLIPHFLVWAFRLNQVERAPRFRPAGGTYWPCCRVCAAM